MSTVNPREQRGRELADRLRIVQNASGSWSVPSDSQQGKYVVRPDESKPSCSCKDFELTGHPCKHIYAVRFVIARDGIAATPTAAEPEPVPEPAKPKRPTYKQNWPLYNLAQQTEKRRFQSLLFDLCQGVTEPPQPKTGRKRTTMADMVFAATFKVFSTVSSRRFACDLADAHEQGYLSQLMNSVSVCAFLESPLMTPVLSSLIVQSSLPLKAIETVFAPDSSGFSTSRFVRWYDEKYGDERSGREWVKAHVICGVKTNIVTAVEIGDKNAGDCPMFKPLVETTAKKFTVKEVPADKAYLSHDNLELLEGMGGTAYVPFKSNSTSGEKGSLWERMFHYYNFKREEFLKHYHQRSNAESTFSMVKAKFRDHVRSKTDVAMKNEVLCKFLCHNICVVHQSHIELGIAPVFWDDEPVEEEESGMILPMTRFGD